MLPLFLRTSIVAQLLLVLFIHPFLLECTEAFFRASTGGNITRLLEKGMTKELAHRRITQASLSGYGVKVMFAFFKRFMLLNIGDSNAKIVALTCAAVEETATRIATPSVDRALYRFLSGGKKLSGVELEAQRVVW